MDLVTAHGIEESKVYLVLVTKAYMTDKGRKDEIAYAKALGKPFALVIEEGVDPSDWFDGCDVIDRITFDRNNFNNKQIGDWLKSLLKRGGLDDYTHTIPTKLNEKAESEFGKGLVICLVKFAEHAEKWFRDKELYQQMHEKEPAFFNESRAVELFFNGASDHLYDIEVPEKWEGTAIESKVKKLQDLALTIGHGFTGQEWSEENVITAYDLCREVALLIDKELGLSPDIGKW